MKLPSVILLGIGIVAFSAGCAERLDPALQKQGTAAAQTWLEILDREDYAASWEEAASLFKAAVEKDRWVKDMQALRKPMGKALSRQPGSARYQTSGPGVPDGQYLMVQFNTSFANKKKAVETVTPMRETNGQWRVCGYYIR